MIRYLAFALLFVSFQAFAESKTLTPFLRLVDQVFPLQMPQADMPALVPQNCSVASAMTFKRNDVQSFEVEVANFNRETGKIVRSEIINVMRDDRVQFEEKSSNLATYRGFNIISPGASIPKLVGVCMTQDGRAGSITLQNENGPIICDFSLTGEPIPDHACMVGRDVH